MFLAFTNLLDDCTSAILKEKKEEAKKSEVSGLLFNLLLQLVQRHKMTAIVERNLM